MFEELDRDQLILLAEQSKQGEGTEEQVDDWLEAIDRSVPAPTGFVCGLIFWPDGTDALTSAKIVDKALVCKPIHL